MGEQNRELPIPDASRANREAYEVVRVWVGKKQDVSLRAAVWEDPAAWGILLCDLAKHIAASYVEPGGRSKAETLRRIRLGFEAEMSSPTDEPSGGVVK